MPPIGALVHASNNGDKSRVKTNDEFHRAFKNIIPANEHILAPCVKGSIFQRVTTDGKFWISEFHLCFKANWPNSTKFCIDLSNVVNIKKGIPYYLIKDAIEIETEQGKYLVGNFSNTLDFKNKLLSVWDEIVPPASFCRKFPDLRNTHCACPRPELSSCDLCKKVKEINLADTNGTQRLPDCPSFKSKSKMYNRPDLSISTPELSTLSREKGSDLLRVNTLGRNVSRTSMPALNENEELHDITLIVPTAESSDSSSVLSRGISKCSCADDTDLSLIHESVYPLTIQAIWNEWQCITAEGSIFLDFLYEVQKISKLKLTPWTPEHSPDEDLKYVEDAFEDGFAPDLSQLKAGYFRRTERLLPLNHGIPFIPKTAVGTDFVKIIHVLDDKELCVFTAGALHALGLETTIKFCLKGNGNSTVFRVFGLAKATGKGKINPPKSKF